MSLLLLLISGLFLWQPTAGRGNDDYWAEDFDKNKNCQQEEKIAKLKSEATEKTQADISAPTQCSSVLVEDSDKERAFKACKQDLAKQVKLLCAITAVNSSGDLLYCEDRGVITCCYENHSCVGGWDAMDDQIYKRAKEYLTGPEEYIDTQVRPMGYKTCHILNSSLDATLCAEDCDRLKKEDFATDCKDNKRGLYKCCIRRDDAFCHECRFCCTLSICTYPSEQGKPKNVFDVKKLELKDQKSTKTASDLYNSEQHIWKDWDYRCLVPYSNDDPTKWKTYEMHDYRKAVSEEELEKVDQFKYNNNFENFVDPKVLKYFTKSTKSVKKAWKKTYGFPSVTLISWDGKNISPSNNTKCFKKCARFEKSNFAKTCRKKGGFFKCCVMDWHLSKFEMTRNKLIEEGLIKDEPTSWCKPGWEKDPCVTCNTDAMCTKKDKKTGKIRNTFIKKYKKEHRVMRYGNFYLIQRSITYPAATLSDFQYSKTSVTPKQDQEMKILENFREILQNLDEISVLHIL